ncbi:MAG: TldD/PmbA family protein [Tissierellia bacterium]|nr:TldD/PmbA family protein [Tissierellia bacterium]
MHKLLLEAKKHLDEAEIYFSSSSNTTIGIFEGELDSFEMAESGGLGLRGLKGDRMGYSYSENPSEEGYEDLIQGVLESLEIVDEKEDLYDGLGAYEEVEKKELIKASPDDVIEGLKKLEELVLKNPGISKVSGAVYQEVEARTSIENTLGLKKESSSAVAFVYVMAACQEGQDTHSGIALRTFWDFSQLDLEALAEDCIEDCLSRLGARSLESGEYKVLIDKESFNSLSSSFSSVFSAEMVEKKMSLLEGRLGEKIASSSFSLKMEPLGKDTPMPSQFDGEGYPRSNFYLIKDGVLKSFYHNRATAKKAGVRSTGNASRSYKGRLGLAPSHLVIEGGERSEKEILSTIKKGVYIKELQGFHSGLNAVSGDFSLPASGFYVEDGKIIHPINQVLLSGNYFELIDSILELSSDRSERSLSSSSPGVLVDKLSLGGI